MKRGEIWTLHDDRYAGKARPVVIVQDYLADASDSVILTLFTTFDNEEAGSRVAIEPSETNGLRHTSFVMVEKLLTVRRSELGTRVGMLTDDQMHDISRILAQVLGITAADLPTSSH